MALAACTAPPPAPQATIGPELGLRLSDALGEVEAWQEEWDLHHCGEEAQTSVPMCRNQLLIGGVVARRTETLFTTVRDQSMETNETREIARVSGLAGARVDEWITSECEIETSAGCVIAALEAAQLLRALSDAAAYYEQPSDW